MIWRTADILGKVNLVETVVNKTTDSVTIDQGKITDDYNVTKSALALLSRPGAVKSNNGSKGVLSNVLE